ncbi:MAG TPA: HPF/RaiA family ribosome-associated protein [Candidatus Eisenbacteria bacterium]|nr:HPF/RaiA family ribosome-associated protein [Candidatus Eisenbacteria bacterium]
MDLEIQTEHIELDPNWRDLIETLANHVEARYPELLRLHVTLKHGPHHRVGFEDVALVANVEGRTFRAEKREEKVRAAIHAAFHALDIEMERYHQERRRVTKPPGARPQGSIKRIFRDAGYGFIHYEPGRDVYFNRASLHGIDFADLQPGFPVEFELETGVKGLQASRVFMAGDRARV